MADAASERKFRDLLAVRLDGRRTLAPSDEKALLSEAVTGIGGMNLREAGAILAEEAARARVMVESLAEREIEALAGSLAHQGEIAKADLGMVEALARPLVAARGAGPDGAGGDLASTVAARLAHAGIRIRQGAFYPGPRSWYETPVELRQAGGDLAAALVRAM
jgi:hypothetical protein